MGRNIKEGLSYFPLDVDFFEDSKVEFLSARFGVKGDGILTRLLCKIYRQGYSLEFNDDVALLFARSVGDINLHGLVKDVVNELLKRGFFNEPIFKRFGLLTSKGIQKRYVKICTDAKRKDWQIPEKMDLLRSKSAKTPEEIEETTEESAQSKVKKSKGKKSKVLEGESPHTPEQKILFEEFEKWITKNTPRVNQLKEPLTIDEYFKLKKKVPKETLTKVLRAMQNRADLLKKYVSAYLTILNWSSREDVPETTPANNVNERLKAAWK